jgi:hypothetical protein
MKAKREINKTFMGVIIIILMLGSLALMLFSPEVTFFAKVLFVAAFLGIGCLLVWSQLDRHFKRSLGREMRTSSKTEHAAVPAEQKSVSAKPRGVPARPFTYQVFDVRREFAGSSEADRLLERGHKYYRHYVLNLMICALFLWVALLILSLSNALLVRGSYLSLNALCGSTLLLLAGFVLAAPRRYLTSFTFSVWLGLNLIFLAPVVYISIRSHIQGLASQAEF